MDIPTSPWTVRSVSLFPIYKSGMTNTAAAITGASIRSPSSFPGKVHHHGAFVFVIGVLCIRAVGEDCLIDVCQMQVLPNIPSHHSLPACQILAPFPVSYVTASGVVSSPQDRLSDQKSVVTVRLSQYVQGSVKAFEVACVLLFTPRDPFLTLPSTAASYHPLNSS